MSLVTWVYVWPSGSAQLQHVHLSSHLPFYATSVSFPAIGRNVNTLYLITISLHVLTLWIIVQSFLVILKQFQRFLSMRYFLWNHFRRQIFTTPSISMSRFHNIHNACLYHKWKEARLSFLSAHSYKRYCRVSNKGTV